MPHIGLAYLAATLHKAGHKVEVIDLYFSDNKEQDEFFNKDFGLIGITCTSFSFVTCLQTAQAIKRLNPNQIIVVGGPHASVAREEVLINKEIDFAIYGEGETPMLSLVELLDDDKNPSLEKLSQINGLIFRNAKNRVVNPPAHRIRDIDSLPFPIYDSFPMKNYEMYPLSSSRGCPYDCAYCASSAIMGRKWVERSPESLLKEIEEIIKKWGKRHFYIIDDSFNINEERVKKFCRQLLAMKLDITWGACGFRADKSDPEMLYLMKKAGCKHIEVGVESANQRVLDNIGKGESIEQIKGGIRKIHEAGIQICGMFMIGNPGDTLDTVRESIEFAKAQPFDSIRFYLALPYPRTRLWEFVKEHGRFLRKDYTNFHDFSEVPIFETDSFTCEERMKAYEEAKKLMFPKGFPEELSFTKEKKLVVEYVSNKHERIKPRFAPQ